MIRDLVHGFYARVRAEEDLGPVFGRIIAPDAWPAHLDRMCDFWSSVTLMTGRYSGTPMPVHARMEGLTPALFGRWLALFEATAAELCPPAARDLFIAKARMIAQSLQLGAAIARGELAPLGAPIR